MGFSFCKLTFQPSKRVDFFALHQEFVDALYTPDICSIRSVLCIHARMNASARYTLDMHILGKAAKS
jgi:hypothetical protein